ncbi:MAG: hypothetical protein EOO77_32710 [Oxalobacteraceae bacterium]|nr:MAG: hypothetical protein EOO77_32710 [Oxalobacteraceae bacterium]
MWPYDRLVHRCGAYSKVLSRYAEASVIVPPRWSAVPSDTAQTSPTMRNRYLQIIAMHGLVAWQKVAGHNRRALVEVDISRFNRVIGDGF